MTSFYYYNQNPSGFCFLVQIRSFVIFTSLGLQNLNMKGKTKRIVVVAVKRRYRAKWPIPSPVALEGPRGKFARPRLPEVSLHPLSPSNEYPHTNSPD